MSLAEVIFRIGASLGGWLIFLGFALTLSAIPAVDCDPGSDTLWRGTLLFAVLAALGLAFVGRGLQWSRTLRWVALPAGLLAIHAGYGIFGALVDATFAAGPLCAIADSPGLPAGRPAAPMLERAWPVVQIGVLVFGLTQAIRTWRVACAGASS
jgi:hypothetical protein